MKGFVAEQADAGFVDLTEQLAGLEDAQIRAAGELFFVLVPDPPFCGGGACSEFAVFANVNEAVADEGNNNILEYLPDDVDCLTPPVP